MRPHLKRIWRVIWRGVFFLLVFLILVPLALQISPISRFVQNRLHRRIEAGLTRVLGRPVKGGDIDFTTLSGFGFNLDNVYIGEAPGFGLEQFVYAEKVHFVLTWRAIFSGRLALSRISLTRASINLVRNQRGQWNVGTWMSPDAASDSQPGQSPQAVATASSLPCTIYLDEGRVNFKDLSGSFQKKVFFLSGVSGKIGPTWFDNGIDFDVRLRPSRTDVPMENSGELRLTGSLGPFKTQDPWSAVIQGEARLEKMPYSDLVALLTGRLTYLHGLLGGRGSFHGTIRGGIGLEGQLDLMDLHSLVVTPREKYTSASLLIRKGEIENENHISMSDGVLRVGSSEIRVTARVDRTPSAAIDVAADCAKLHLQDGLEFLKGFTNRILPSTQLPRDAHLQYRLSGPWQSPRASAQIDFQEGQIKSDALPRPAAYSAFSATYEEGTLFWDPIQFVSGEGRNFQVNGSLTDIFKGRELVFQASAHHARLNQIEGLGRSFGLWPVPAKVDGIADLAVQWGPSRRHSSVSALAGSVNARDLTIDVGATDPVRIAVARLDSKNNQAQVIVTKLNWGRSVASGTLRFNGINFRDALVNINANFLDVNDLLRLGEQVRQHLGVSTAGTSSGPGVVQARPPVTWTGSVNAIWFYLRQFEFTKFHSNFTLGEGRFELQNFTVDSYGGKSQGSFAIDWKRVHPTMHLEGHVENAKLAAATNLLTPLGPALRGKVGGDFILEMQKQEGQPWSKYLTAHVGARIRDLENVNLNLPSGIQQLQEKLHVNGLPSFPKVLSSLDLDLNYGEAGTKIEKAKLTMDDLAGEFVGACTKSLDLNLTGTLQKTSAKSPETGSAVQVIIQGPLKQPRLTIQP